MVDEKKQCHEHVAIEGIDNVLQLYYDFPYKTKMIGSTHFDFRAV